MDLDDDVLPEEYVDTVMQEFAYDPIKLPHEEDFSQVLYNRRTLETIWDTKQDAINPYTRQPFHIHNAIPQTQLKQQMQEYILNNRSVTLSLGLEVVPDYTQILNEIEMKNLLIKLVSAGNHCQRFLKECDIRNKEADEEKLGHWKALWKILNLVRLYCQYRPENRDVFSSINGYQYLFQVISTQLLLSCHEFSGSLSDYAKEVCKEIGRFVDVMGGLKEKDLLMAPENSVSAFVLILYDLAHCQYLKINSMVLRIYRGMFEDCFDYLIRNKVFPISYMVELALFVLSGQKSPRDVVNEDLYNGMRILKAAWMSGICQFQCPQCVEVICMAVTVCISRLEVLHDAVTVREAQTISTSSSYQEVVEKNIHFISMALEDGLFLISSRLTFLPSQEETLQRMNIVKQLIRMSESGEAGNNLFQLSHFRFGLQITAAIRRGRQS